MKDRLKVYELIFPTFLGGISSPAPSGSNRVSRSKDPS